MKRRTLLKSIALSGSGTILGPNVFSQTDGSNNSKILNEPARKTKVVQNTDVIVCGGGPAGISAAISAARTGAKTTLIEMYGCLGGVWTTGLLSNIIDYENKPGLMRELVTRLESNDAQYSARIYDPELMKVTLDQMCIEAGVNIRLYTRVTGAYRNSNNKLGYITTESFSGREAWKAKVFIDTTGNGDLAALSGCNFDIGHPETGQTQPMSLMTILTGLDEEKVSQAGFMTASGGFSILKNKNWFYNEIYKAGIEASYSRPTLFSIRPGLVAMMANHQYGASALDAQQITEATLLARNELNQIVDGLRRLGGLWSNVRIVSTAGQIGIREGRRIHGRYMITKEDLLNGAKFKDAVCSVTFGIDIHSLSEKGDKGYGNDGMKAKPYEIPLRSLIAKDLDGLMMAGRCISGDFIAHASYRVTGNAVAMGEAAGQVAAKAALNNKLPQEIQF